MNVIVRNRYLLQAYFYIINIKGPFTARLDENAHKNNNPRRWDSQKLCDVTSSTYLRAVEKG